MPIYEYKCASCGSVFEALMLRSNDVPTCPDCDSTDVARLMSAPAARRADSSASTPCGECCGGECAPRSCGCAGACHCH